MKPELNNQTPIKGQKILLRGFDAEQEAEAKNLLVKHGYQVATSIALADVLVVGMGDATTAVEVAKKSKIPVTSWSDFRSRLSETVSQSTIAELPCHPAVKVGRDYVHILDQVLPRSKANNGPVPSADQFWHICLDACFMRNARAVAVGVRHGLPVALEGETAASKTAAILWVAGLMGQPVVRLNLHGQSDTGELIGRYVPNARKSVRNGNGLVDGNHVMFNPASKASKRPASPNRCRTCSVEDRSSLASWVFQEGYVPQAMRQGWWVILDEMNLAEPQVLERLNPVIEQPPSLVLSESDGTIFGASGTVPVASGFRMFATLNPADYVGRSVLSPAFRDRWPIWHHAESPSESDFAAMLRFLIFGEQPEFIFHGKRYQAPPGRRLYHELASVHGIQDVLPRLALFHSSLYQASGMGGAAPALGRLRRERYVFTRRELLTCLQLLQRARAENPGTSFDAQLHEAIEIAYLGRISGADRSAVISLLRAAGLPEK
jgi:MoxR-like ATPase